MTRYLMLFFAATMATSACGRSAPDAGRPANGASTNEAATPASDESGASSTTAATPCPRTGLWALCSVEKRLVQSGFVVQRGDAEGKARPGFSVKPTVYSLGQSRLEVFIYPSVSAANSDVTRIDTVSAAPRGSANPWGATPTFVRSGNLLAVFLTDNATRAERLTLALTAGAPQP